MLKDPIRERAFKWFTTEFNKNYKGKVKPAAEQAAGPAAPSDSDGARGRHVNRRKTSAASFFANSDDGEDSEGEGEGDGPSPEDELKEYLAVPQIKYKTENDALQWWKDNEERFPNVAVMARQYLGCPASSASVERLFSQVGIAFSVKRKSASAETLESIMFASANLP